MEKSCEGTPNVPATHAKLGLTLKQRANLALFHELDKQYLNLFSKNILFSIFSTFQALISPIIHNFAKTFFTKTQRTQRSRDLRGLANFKISEAVSPTEGK